MKPQPLRPARGAVRPVQKRCSLRTATQVMVVPAVVLSLRRGGELAHAVKAPRSRLRLSSARDLSPTSPECAFCRTGGSSVTAVVAAMARLTHGAESEILEVTAGILCGVSAAAIATSRRKARDCKTSLHSSASSVLSPSLQGWGAFPCELEPLVEQLPHSHLPAFGKADLDVSDLYPQDKAEGEVPDACRLQDLFHRLADPRDNEVKLEAMPTVIDYLEASGSFGLAADDHERLFSYLCSFAGSPEREGVPAASFITGIQILTASLQRLKQNSCALRQIKVVLTVAFERFDVDCSGNISFPEFLSAAECMGLPLTGTDAEVLYSFLSLCPEKKVTLEGLAAGRSPVEMWAVAVRRSLVHFRKSKGIDGIATLFQRMTSVSKSEGSLDQKMQRVGDLLWGCVDDVCRCLDVMVETAGVGVAAIYSNEILEQALQDHIISSPNIASMLPFLTLIGVFFGKIGKELEEFAPKQMSEQEAQLYGQVFHPHGFSQSEFLRILGCPSFRWSSADVGETFHSPDDRRFKILLHGSAQIHSTGHTSVSAHLPPGSVIGETSFLRKRCLWHKEQVTAREPLFFASWDAQELREHLSGDADLCLRLDQLLTQTVVSNFRTMVQLTKQRSLDQHSMHTEGVLVNGPVQRLFESMDINKDGVVSMSEFASSHSEQGAMTREAIGTLIPSLLKRLNLANSEENHLRLFAFLDVNNDGVLDAGEFRTRLAQIEDFTADLRGLSLQELQSIIFRAFEKFDANGDGRISEQEFMQLADKLSLPLSHPQLRQLFCFFDADKDESIHLSEWKAGLGNNLSWEEALLKSLQDQAEKKGLTELGVLLQEVWHIATQPKDLVWKLHQVAAKVSDSTEALAEVVNAGLDATGANVALCGIWREMEGIGSWDDISDMDLAPFVIFFSILTITVARRKAEGDASDLTADEAILYATAFEGEGFTVTEFQQMLKCGKARWETVEAGSVVPSSRSTLSFVVHGTCKIHYLGTEATARGGRGTILGAPGFLGVNDLSQRTVANEPMKVLHVDHEAMSTRLEHKESLRMRLNQQVARSMVDTFHGSEAVWLRPALG